MKQKTKYVMVDLGYNLNEHWYKVKVISSRICKNLFDDGESTDLLVELPGGERSWVSFWDEIPQK